MFVLVIDLEIDLGGWEAAPDGHLRELTRPDLGLVSRPLLGLPTRPVLGL